MLGEVNLTHTTSAEQALNNVASEDLTVVQRHVRKPTNDKANADKERGHQKAKDSEGMLAPITESMVLWPHRHVAFLQDLLPSSGQAPTLLPPADWSRRPHPPPPHQPAAGQ